MKVLQSILPLFIPLLLTTLSNAIYGADTLSNSLFNRSIEELVEQEVTIATKSSQKISQTPSVVSVITAEEIESMGYRELKEVLASIPGVIITQTRLGSISNGIRGVGNIRQGGRILVLLDGTPYNDVMYGSSVFFGATFNLDAVERIEVIRGPGSALYGKNAFSSVINIITKKATSDNNVEIGTSYGSFNTFDAHASYGIKKEKFNANINARYLTTDGTDSEYNNGEGGKDIWNLKHDNIYLNANAEYKNFQFFGSFYQRVDGVNTATPLGDFITNGSTEFRVGTYNLTYNKDIATNTSINVKLYGRNEHRFQDFELAKPTTTDTFYIPQFDVWIPFNSRAAYPQGGYAEPVFDAYTYGTEIEMSFQLLKNNRLLAGIQGDLHGVRNAKVRSNYDLATNAPIPNPNDPDIPEQYSREDMPIYEPGWIKDNGHDYKNAAIYFQDVHYFTNSLSATIGGRFDYNSEVGYIFNPRLGLVWEPSKHSSLKLLYGRAYRAPTTSEQYKINGADMGNDSLDHEVINTYEIAFGFNHEKLFTQLSVYYNQLNDIILSLDTEENPRLKSYFNRGENTSYGVELEAKYILNRSIYAYGNYSYTQSEDRQNTDSGSIVTPHANIANHIINLGVNTRLIDKVNWSAWIRYVGPIEKFRSNILLDNGYISEDIVGDYFLLNSSLRVTDLFKGFEISLHGYNLLNTEYYFQDDTFSHQPKQARRHFLLRARYNFTL